MKAKQGLSAASLRAANLIKEYFWAQSKQLLSKEQCTEVAKLIDSAKRPSVTLIPPPPMSAKEAIPCAVCQSPGESTGDFADYIQCTNNSCPQRAFAIHDSVWPSILTDEEKQRTCDESEE